MRCAVLLFATVTLVTASDPAFAELPIAVRAVVGGGPGVTIANGGASNGPFSGALALDLAWRDRPGHAYVLAYDIWYAGDFGVLADYRFEHGGFESRFRPGTVQVNAITIGIERGSRASASGGFVQLTAGMGSMMIRDEGFFGYPGVRPPVSSGPTGLGVALAAQAALRIVPAPSPLGFIIGLRTGHIMSRVGRAHSLLFEVGLTFHPQGGTKRDRDEPEWIEAAQDVRSPSRAS